MSPLPSTVLYCTVPYRTVPYCTVIVPFAFFQKIAKRSVTPQRTRVFLKVRCNLLVYPSAQGVSRKLEYPGRHTNNMANTWSSYVAKKVKTITRSINLKAWEIIPFMYATQATQIHAWTRLKLITPFAILLQRYMVTLWVQRIEAIKYVSNIRQVQHKGNTQFQAKGWVIEGDCPRVSQPTRNGLRIELIF